MAPVISNKDVKCTRKFKFVTAEAAAKICSQSRKVIEHFSSFLSFSLACCVEYEALKHFWNKKQKMLHSIPSINDALNLSGQLSICSLSM